MGQTLLGFDDVLEVLEDGFIQNPIKGPYLRFFLSVYINTRDESPELQAANLRSSARLWSCISKLITDSALGKSSPLDGDEEHFLFKCLLPLVSRLVQQYYAVDTCDKADACVKLLGNSLAQFIMRNLPTVSDRFHIKALSDAIMVLSNKCRLRFKQELLDQLGVALGRAEQGLTASKAQTEYLRKYEKEMELNTKFSAFAQRLFLAYCGPNLMHNQIPACAHVSKLKDEPYSETQEDDEFLPQTPDFQSLLRVFATLGNVKTEEVKRQRRRKESV